MKKLVKLFAAIGLLSLAASFAGCTMLTEEELKEKVLKEAEAAGGNTIGNAWGAMFSNRSHNPIDLQVWQGFDATYDNDNGMKCLINNPNPNSPWVGGAIVQNCHATVSESLFYDMSKVEKVTFKVKATKNMAIWAGYANQAKTDSFIKQNINVTTDWQNIEIVSKGVSAAWAIFGFGSDNPGQAYNGGTLYFKDITYLDNAGNSLTLKYSK